MGVELDGEREEDTIPAAVLEAGLLGDALEEASPEVAGLVAGLPTDEVLATTAGPLLELTIPAEEETGGVETAAAVLDPPASPLLEGTVPPERRRRRSWVRRIWAGGSWA